MKRLKFKVWDREKEIFLKDVFIGSDGQLYQFSKDTMFGAAITFLDSENKKILQFTGLRDKNGYEIYEGDIVNLKGDLYTVSWHGCFSSFDMTNIDKAKHYKDLYYLNKDFEKSVIVGNIYQNREMLKNDSNIR